MKTIALLATTALFAQNPATLKAPVAATTTESKSILVIDPKFRATDYIQAFEMLRKDKPTLKVVIQTTNGMLLDNVTEVSTVHNGTILMIKYASSSGSKYQVVPIEEISEMNYSSL